MTSRPAPKLKPVSSLFEPLERAFLESGYVVELWEIGPRDYSTRVHKGRLRNVDERWANGEARARADFAALCGEFGP